MEYKFCKFCGKKIEKNSKVCSKCGKIYIREKSSRYLLTKSQIIIVKKKLLPLLFTGFILWMLTGLFYSGYISAVQIKFNMNIYILLVILDIILFVIVYFSSYYNKKVISLLSFLIFFFLNGILSSLIMIWVKNKLSQQSLTLIYISAIILAIFSTMCGFSRGRFRSIGVGRRFYNPKDFWYFRLTLFGLWIVIFYLYFAFFIEVFRNMIGVIILLLVIIYTEFVIHMDNYTINTHLKEDNWVFWAFNLLIDLITMCYFWFFMFSL